jgi:hypothetical protein
MFDLLPRPAYDQSVFDSWEKSHIMHIRRVIVACFALVLASAAAPALLAQNAPSAKPQQEKRTKQEQQDIDALIKFADAVSAGSQPAPTDIPITWEFNHFVRAGDGATFVPFTLSVDRAKLSAPGIALYLRVVSKAPAPAPAGPGNNRDNDRNRQGQQPVTYPWDSVYFLDVPADGRVQRAIAVKPGNYEVFISAKERTPERQPRNAPPLKVGVLRRDLTIPDFGTPALQTSSIIIASAIEAVTSQLTPAEQQAQPYSFGPMRVVPSQDHKLKKTGELQVLFWVYGAATEAGKPNLVIEYSFHQKTGDAEKYFNKTAPQELNAQTLPPEFNVAAGHQLPGSIVVPLASFPEGDYRLEIKITDKVSGKALTENEAFSVVAG